jgi:hypothetical protein
VVVVLRNVQRLLVTANVPSSLILVTLTMKALSSSEASVLPRATRRNIPDDGFLQSPQCKSQLLLLLLLLLLLFALRSGHEIFGEQFMMLIGRRNTATEAEPFATHMTTFWVTLVTTRECSHGVYPS